MLHLYKAFGSLPPVVQVVVVILFALLSLVVLSNHEWMSNLENLLKVVPLIVYAPIGLRSASNSKPLANTQEKPPVVTCPPETP